MSERADTFDFEVNKHIRRKETDEDHAVVALLTIAKYLREYGALPSNLAEYLADAIVASMVKPKGKRAKAFTDELGLTAKNRRPASTAIDVGVAVYLQTREGKSVDAGMNAVAEELGVDKKTIAKYQAEMKRFIEYKKKD